MSLFYRFILIGLSVTTLCSYSLIATADNHSGANNSDSFYSWDLDSNGVADALSDGLVMLRYNFGLRGDPLIADAISQDSGISSSEIETRISNMSSVADIDGNLEVDALSDGLLLLRYLFGLRGELLIKDIVASDASRSTVTEILAHIDAYMPGQMPVDNDGVPDTDETTDTDATTDTDTTTDTDETSDTDGDGIVDNTNSLTGPQSSYCSTPMYHLNMTNEAASLINLTVENTGDNSVRISIVTGDTSPLDYFALEQFSSASFSDDPNATGVGYSKLLTWSGTMPDNTSGRFLWSKTTTGGIWIVDINVETAAICNGVDNSGGSGDSDTVYEPYEGNEILQNEEIAVASGILVGGVDSSKPYFTVYLFDNDSDSLSTCYGGCANAWPPVYVTDESASGILGLGTIERNDGSKQATFDGMPLYFWSGDQQIGDRLGEAVSGWHAIPFGNIDSVNTLYNDETPMEPVTSFVRDDGVVITRFGDRGRDRHAKDIGEADRYDHYLSKYWKYRTVRIQFEDYVQLGQSKISATWITEEKLDAWDFRTWYRGINTTGEFHSNPGLAPAGTTNGIVRHGSGTWDDNFVKISDEGSQYKHTFDITSNWSTTPHSPLTPGTNMEFEVSMFLDAPPNGGRLNYYGTSFVYVIGEPGLKPFEWQRDQKSDGTPIPSRLLSGGDTTLGYNYTQEPAGRFMQMATNMAPGNAQPFVRGRRLHHTSFVDGVHGERETGSGDGEVNPIWSEQIGKADNHYIGESCASCHVRNGKALVADVGQQLEKWVFNVGDENGNPLNSIGRVLQPLKINAGVSEGMVTLDPWTEYNDGPYAGLRSPNYNFSNGTPPQFSARIAPQIVGVGLLEAVDESTIMSWVDENDDNDDEISGRASFVEDPETNEMRLGRFGYKAGTFSVKHQVASAFNTDMGVMTSMLPTPDCGAEQTDCGNSSGAELTDEHVDDLVKYVSLLGVGARRDNVNQAGEALFQTIGCAGCHRPSMITSNQHPLAELRGQTIYPYTDMLLHDMGPGLADNLAEGTASGSEWRTAPLWGLGLVKNVMLGDAKANDLVSLARDPHNDPNRIGYLHDGRARTIDEAIRWHGGEAETARIAYDALDGSARNALLNFLESL